MHWVGSAVWAVSSCMHCFSLGCGTVSSCMHWVVLVARQCRGGNHQSVLAGAIPGGAGVRGANPWNGWVRQAGAGRWASSYVRLILNKTVESKLIANFAISLLSQLLLAKSSKIRSAWWAWTAGPQFSQNWLPQLPCFMCTSCSSTLSPPSTSRAWSRPEPLFLSLARCSVNPCIGTSLNSTEDWEVRAQVWTKPC